MNQKINYDDLKYFTKSTGVETDFSAKTNPIVFFNDIKTKKIKMEEAKASEEDFNKYLNLIRRGKKSEKRKRSCQILIFFLMEEMILSNLQKTMVQ